MKSKNLLVLVIVLALVACKTKEKEDDLQVEVAPQDTVQIVEVPEPEPEPVEEVDLGVNLDDKYFLVVDTYTVKAFAESWEQKYKQEGYKPAVIMRNEDGYYRLALQSFKDFDLAKEALRVLRLEDEFEDAWIMVIEK
ncbi:SPOR domain-containing protein [uncultured Sunxiuqinia sp.]|jgi:biopolymer transport protein ExbD|uniref:SPOR domain-containing protein n=1 Tax=uncultured Sunxiuqinia sp. TaxID=1573825 RepID=UPI0030D6F953|tara:strand:- start:7292 stop:7705 length:414 start_codon:yes stop_codon:yes gene_type:complete